MQPIQQPITGNEDLGNLHQPTQALAQFYAAINHRDLDEMGANWLPSPEIAMDNPLGGIRRGWEEIGAVYARLFASRAQFHFEFRDYTIHQAGDLFYAVGRERGELAIREQRMILAIRTSRIYRRVDDIWRQVHHHGSIDDPDMLRNYQNAVLRNAWPSFGPGDAHSDPRTAAPSMETLR
ncbi:MAG TPA: nuclear transport factor 2 family protein [Burkholderiales bacterium]|jgi:ketosteroid isomerase-like protein|nr:nuclear transport factor 2 family protein [Burkholderiales bacterium]